MEEGTAVAPRSGWAALTAFVRDRDGYDQALSGVFGKVRFAIHDDYSRLPYTFIVGISQK